MSVIQNRIELIKRQNEKLSMLLADPQPGLMSWLSFVAETVAEINAIMDGKRDE